MAWQDKKNAVLADSCYCDNQLAAQDVSITLPGVSFLTAEVNAMGTMEVVLAGLVEAMEATISKVGIDLGLSRMLTPEKHNFEFRWAQNVLQGDGTSKAEGCKAFVTGVSKGIPGFGLEVGSNIEGEVALSVSRYQLYVNGKEICLIDKIAQICRINGVDYYKKIASFL